MFGGQWRLMANLGLYGVRQKNLTIFEVKMKSMLSFYANLLLKLSLTQSI
jgi:hypothetical protein